MNSAWLERAELVGISLGAFYVGWVLASHQLWFSLEGASQPHWELYALGVPVGVGLIWARRYGVAHAFVARIGLGVWALVGGWSLARPDPPWPIVAHLVPLIVSIHVPLVLIRHPWSSRARTLLRWLGWICFCLAAASALALVLAGHFFPQRFWPRMLPFIVGLPIIYRRMCCSDDSRHVQYGWLLIVLLLGLVVGWLLLTHAGVI